MTNVEAETGFTFHLTDCRREQGGVKLHLCAAASADEVMVGLAGEFVRQVTITPIRHQQDAISGQEFQRAVDGGLIHTSLVDSFIDLCRGKMTTCMQSLQDGKPLGGHAIAALT
jgi:hypothetical protein